MKNINYRDKWIPICQPQSYTLVVLEYCNNKYYLYRSYQMVCYFSHDKQIGRGVTTSIDIYKTKKGVILPFKMPLSNNGMQVRGLLRVYIFSYCFPMKYGKHKVAIRLTFYLRNGDFLRYSILSWHYPSSHYSDSLTNFSNKISISAPHHIE